MYGIGIIIDGADVQADITRRVALMTGHLTKVQIGADGIDGEYYKLTDAAKETPALVRVAVNGNVPEKIKTILRGSNASPRAAHYSAVWYSDVRAKKDIIAAIKKRFAQRNIEKCYVVDVAESVPVNIVSKFASPTAISAEVPR